MKDRLRTSVKEVQKLSAQAKAAVGNAGGPFGGKAAKRHKAKGQWKQQQPAGVAISHQVMTSRTVPRDAQEGSSGRTRFSV